MKNKIKIMLVDDDELFLVMLNEVLVKNGYDVVQASNGSDALNAFTEFSPDIVITDIVMPEIDGFELLTNIRKINPNVRVGVMSGGNSGHADAYLDMAENLGADLVLHKPFKLPDFIEEIKKLESI